MSINKRLDRLRSALEPMQPARLTVTLKDGSTSIEDAETVWNYFKDESLREQVVDVEANRVDHVELAGLILALCRS